MINIEIIGFLERSCVIADSVRELFKQKSYINNIRITWNGGSNSLNLADKKKWPHFRLVTTLCDHHIKEVKELLTSMNVDIEIMFIDRLIEAKKPESE